MSKSTKGEQYAAELAGLRLRGEWTSTDGISQIHGGSKKIDWPELLRKFTKHNPDKKLVADVATVEQELRSQLIHLYAAKHYTDASHAQDAAGPTREGRTAFPPVPASAESGEGWSHEKLESVLSRLASLQQEAHSEQQRSAIIPVHALALFQLGRDEDAVALLHDVKFIESLQMDDLKDASHSEDYTVALLMMGFVVYGMANERLHETDPSAGYAPFAFAGYARAIDLHEGVRGGKSANALRGLPADEIERWGERALYRNALLSVREGDLTLGLNALRAYQAHAGRWPSDFRLPQRATIAKTYLQVLNRAVEKGQYLEPPPLPPKSKHDPRSQAYQFNVVQSVASRVGIRDFASERIRRDDAKSFTPGVGSRAIASRTVSSRRPNQHLVLRPGSTAWSNEMLTAALSASNTAQRSTQFPKAGDTNASALDLADALVRSWELNGEKGGIDADELIQTLYSLAKVTFHSHRISRSLIRVLTTAELYPEAKLALEHYMRLVDKARQTDAATAANEAKGGQPAAALNGSADATAAIVGQPKKEQKQRDVDDAETYVRTLAYGARLLYRNLGQHAQADQIATKALQIATEDDKLSKQSALAPGLLALVKRVAGVARSSHAIAEASPLTRRRKQEEALTLLLESAKLDPLAAETFYHLAYVQAEMRDVDSATASARKAVELEPASIEPWHLLTLLLSARKDYKAALDVAEVALDAAEKDDEHDKRLTTRATKNVVNGVSAARPAEVRTALLSYDYPPTQVERSEALVRLLITHNALEEVVEGTEVAIEGQKEIFTFFHDRIATEATARVSKAGHTVLSKSTNGALQEDEQQNPSIAHKRGSRLSTLLHIHSSSSASSPQQAKIGSGQKRYGSVTGLGQSGASSARSTSLAKPSTIGTLKNARGLSTALPPPMSDVTKSDDSETPEAQRLELHAERESHLLSSLWLMSAATFRRAGKLNECRVAVQEAERIAPGNADVWLQLALWFVESDNVGLATASLYKALACQSDHIGSAVHLARIFLSNPDSIPATSHDNSAFAQSALTPTPVPRASVKDDFDGTQSRSIGASPPGKKPLESEKFATAADAAASKETKKLTALSLAEGLLNTTTSAAGWDVAEAWLFLGHVAQKTNRMERATECLKYALSLEETKPIRPINVSLSP